MRAGIKLTNHRSGRLARLAGAFLAALGLAGTGMVVSLVVPGGVAEAAPTAVCTWSTSTLSASWSTGSNWVTTSGNSCTGAGGPPTGAAIVFPAGATTTTISYDTAGGSPASSFDSITFEARYTIQEGGGAPASVTLTPSAVTACSSTLTTIALCDHAGNSTFDPGVVLGSGEEFAAHSSTSLEVNGVVSGSSALTAGDSGNTGQVELDPQSSGSCTSNTFSGGTTVASGGLYVLCPSGLGTGTVTVDSSAYLALEPTTGGTVANAIVDDSTASPGGVQVCDNSASAITTTLSGLISGTGSLYVFTCSVQTNTVVLDHSGGDTFGGGTTLFTNGVGTALLQLPVANELSAGGALAIDSGGVVDLQGQPETVDGLSGVGTIENDAPSTTALLTASTATSTFGGLIQDHSGTGGTVGLAVSSGGDLTLTGTNTYSGATTVCGSCTLAVGISGAAGTGLVAVGDGGTLDIHGTNPSARVDLSNQITLGTGGGSAATLEDTSTASNSNGDTVSGPVSIATGATAHLTVDYPMYVTGVISGAGSATVGGTSYYVPSGNNTYSGGTAIASGTAQLESCTALGTGSAALDDGAFLLLDNSAHCTGANSYANALSLGSGTGGQAVVVDAFNDTWAGNVTLTAGSTGVLRAPSSHTFTVTGSLSGSGSLVANYSAYNGATIVLGGSGAGFSGPVSLQSSASGDTLEIQQANSLGTGSVTVPDGGTLAVDNLGAPFTVANALTLDSSGSGTSYLSNTGGPFTWSGAISVPTGSSGVLRGASMTMSGTVTASGSGNVVLDPDVGQTLTVTGTVNSAGGTTVNGGTTTIASGGQLLGTVGVAGGILNGTGTAGSVTSSGTVQAGSPLGTLTAASATLQNGGTGSLSVDITGPTASTDYSQLHLTGTATLTGADLSVSDSYAAPYGTTFTILNANSVSGTFTNCASGATITAGTQKLQCSYGANSVTLTDVTNPPPPPPPPPSPPPSSSSGYDLVGSDGGVFVFPVGSAGGYYGSLPGLGVAVNNIVGMVPTVHDEGYFLVGSDGGVFAFGNAPYLGSLPGLGVSIHNIAGIVPTGNDEGYFLVGRDGGVFSFGNAPFLGSLPGIGVQRSDIIGIAATPSGNGYWLVAADGTVYAFGAAAQLGSATGTPSPVAAISGTPDGGGYWIVTQAGGVYSFGDAGYFSSLPALGVYPTRPVVGIVPTVDDRGYWLIGSDGGIFAFGDAGFVGSLPSVGVDVTNVVGAVPTTI